MKKNIILFSIILLAIFYRFYHLGLNPTILNRDEAAIAYNAYTLAETGMDEWGKSWPLSLESFGDYKLLGYPLLVAGLFKTNIINDMIVRLPSAVSGLGILITTWYLAINVFKEYKLKFLLLCTISLSPVFIFYSRVAYEAHVALFFTILSLFILFIKKKRTILTDLFSLLLLAFACITYNTPLILLPFISILYFFFNFDYSYKRRLLFIFILGLLFTAITIQLVPVSLQKSGVSIFKNEDLILRSAEYYTSFPTPLQTLLGNRYIFFTREMALRFFSSFSFDFLVHKGGTHPWHTLPGWGNIFFITYICGLIGIFHGIFETVIQPIYVVIKEKKKQNKLKYLLTILQTHKVKIAFIYLLVCSLIPSVITVDSPHTTRSLLFIYLFVILSIYGFSFVVSQVKTQLASNIYYTSLFLISIQSCIYFYSYIFIYPNSQPLLYQSKYKNVINDLEKSYSDTDIAIVDSEGYLYISTAWYLKLNPEIFFATVVKQQANKIGFKYGERISNYHFISEKEDSIKTGESVIVYMDKDGKWIILDNGLER